MGAMMAVKVVKRPSIGLPVMTSLKILTPILALDRIQRHDQIPSCAKELGKCLDKSSGRDKLYVLVK